MRTPMEGMTLWVGGVVVFESRVGLGLKKSCREGGTDTIFCSFNR